MTTTCHSKKYNSDSNFLHHIHYYYLLISQVLLSQASNLHLRVIQGEAVDCIHILKLHMSQLWRSCSIYDHMSTCLTLTGMHSMVLACQDVSGGRPGARFSKHLKMIYISEFTI